ncbi:MAG: GNAT family N-acetyltransferase, partial [Burkholderiales bacterium]
MITIRNERKTDATAREALLDVSFGESRWMKASERLREGRLPADELSFAATDRGRLIGTARLWHVSAGPDRPALLLGPVAVDPDWRGRGVGTALLLAQETGADVDPEAIVSRLFRGLRLEEGMIEAVRRARGAGIRTALLSNSWGVELYPRRILDEICDVVVISGEVGLRKPDPAIFALTMRALRIDPAAAVHVGDDPVLDVVGARNAGLRV